MARDEARWRVSALALAACVSALLGGGVGRAFIRLAGPRGGVAVMASAPGLEAGELRLA